MKFFTVLDWRGFISNAQFESTLSWLCHDIMKLGDIDIPEKNRILPSLKTTEEEMRHDLLLRYYRHAVLSSVFERYRGYISSSNC